MIEKVLFDVRLELLVKLVGVGVGVEVGIKRCQGGLANMNVV